MGRPVSTPANQGLRVHWGTARYDSPSWARERCHTSPDGSLAGRVRTDGVPGVQGQSGTNSVRSA